MICARCSKPVTRPKYAGGMVFGVRCFLRVFGPQKRKAVKTKRVRVQVEAITHPGQMDLFTSEVSHG